MMDHYQIRRTFIFVLSGITLMMLSCSFAWAAGQLEKRSQNHGSPVILTNENFFPALVEAIDDAQNEIIMSIFSFKAGKYKRSYPDRIAGHLIRAVKRGVKVTVVLETTDNQSDALNIQNRETGSYLQDNGIMVIFDSPRKTTHTKLIVIDRKKVFLGSHNFTQSALKYNNEISVLLHSPELAGHARSYIMQIIQADK